MELKELFLSLGIGLVAIIALLTWTSGLNLAYNTNAGSTFNSSLTAIQSAVSSNLESTAGTMGTNAQTTEGAGETDQQQGLIKRSLSSLNKVGDFLGLAPNLLYAGASILKIPAQYTDIAVSLVIIVFVLTLVYLLLLGVNKLL